MSAPTAPDLAALQDRIEYRFNDPALLELALTHPSYAQVLGEPGKHNQRLEFLGDAVLQLPLTVRLYKQFPDFSEGPLSKARARMVQERTLAKRSRALGLGEYLRLSPGEDRNHGRTRASSLADAYEALLGAIFLDGGYEAARTFILDQFKDEVVDVDDIPIIDNPKGELQERLQAQSQAAPQYRLVSSSGPDHNREFTCAVMFQGDEIGVGVGKSKQLAESQAALQALRILRDEKDSKET